MAKALRVTLTFILAVVSADCGFSPLLRAQSLDVIPIDVSVLNPPIVFKADGRWDMAYELRISSLADVGDTTISSIQVAPGAFSGIPSFTSVLSSPCSSAALTVTR